MLLLGAVVKMKISELKVGQGKADIEATVKSVEEPREINKFGRTIRVANAMIEDDSGEIKLTLWNKDIDVVSKGSRVKITNGFVNEFNGEKQLTSGKFGKLEVIDGSSDMNEEKIDGEKGSKQKSLDEVDESYM